MLTYSFENLGTETLYEHLYRVIREDIQRGVLMGNEKLPSKRAFAKHLNISTITVENAYAQLLMEGYIYALPRKGYFVSELGVREPVSARKKNGLSNPVIDMDQTVDPVSDRKQNGSEVQRPLFADFSSNQTQPESFPFSVWAKLSRRILSDRQEELMRNAPPGGVLELRMAIAKYLEEFRDIHVKPEQIVVGAGTEFLYGLVIQLLGFDLCYASEEPGYRKVSQVFSSFHVRQVSVPLDQSGLSVQALERAAADVVHTTPSHHFPTGLTMPVARRYELLGWAAARQNRYIIEDDYDSEMRMSGKPLPALLSIDRSESVIYMNTFTKSLASTIRISYMVLPPHLAERFRSRMFFYSSTVSTFDQFTLAEMLSTGLFEKHINRMRNASRKKRDLLLYAIRSSEMGPYTTISEKHAGLHFLMNICLDLPRDRFLQAMREEGIGLTNLSSYFSETAGVNYTEDAGNLWHIGDGLPEHTFVVNYSSVPEQRLEEAVARMNRCIRKLHRERGWNPDPEK